MQTTCQSESGVTWAKLNIIFFGVIVLSFMTLFCFMAFYFSYRSISDGSTTSTATLAILALFDIVSLVLIFRIIPACIKSSISELKLRVTLDADKEGLKIHRSHTSTESILWKDYESVWIETYYLGCKAVVVSGRKKIIFGVTLSNDTKYEICQWIDRARKMNS